MVMLISYDLNKHERPSAYAAVEKIIKDTVGQTNYIKALYSQWLVDSTISASTWSEKMKSVTDKDDMWLIVPITGNHSGWLNTNVVDWLNSRV